MILRPFFLSPKDISLDRKSFDKHNLKHKGKVNNVLLAMNWIEMIKLFCQSNAHIYHVCNRIKMGWCLLVFAGLRKPLVIHIADVNSNGSTIL